VTASPGRIQVPQWYARFSSGDVRDPRGPANADQEAVRIGPVTVFKSRCGVELATFGSPDDPGVALIDGYLFERQSLRRELAIDPGASDAEIAAAAYQRWGDEVFDRLDGSYLLAIRDPRTRMVLLGHDALGHHPVFYATASDAVWFGSNVLALSSCGQISKSPNKVSLALAALTQWPAAGQTFFESIQRLRPGRYLTITDDHQIREHEYWSPWLRDGEPELSEQEVTEQFESFLMGAVLRCMALNPEGIMLSGGLDSVTIAALAAEYSTSHGRPLITAVSGRRDFPPSEEEPVQSATTAALGMRHLIAKESEWTGKRNEIDLSLEVIPELPGPSRVYWVGAYMAFYRHTAAQNVRVLLTGSGGDNWVAAGDAYAAETMRSFQVREVARFLRSYVNTGGLSFSSAARHLLWSGGLRLLLDSFTARWMPGLKARYHRRSARVHLPDWICPDGSLKEALIETLYSQRPPALDAQGRVPASHYRHAQRSVVNPYYQYEFETGFHIESTCGLRLLSPYHDRQLVRFLNSVPPAVLLKGSRYKGLLRPIAQRRLPGLGLEQQRKDYAPGVLSAQMNDLRQGIGQAWPTGRFETLGHLGVVDPGKVAGAFVPSATSDFSQLLSMYALLSADRWVGVHTAI
jgi:asparagine synthase (glutamine-hydrolysing)